MKKLLSISLFSFLIILLISINCYATNYYFASNGNDGNAGTIAAPWLTIAKFNSVFSTKLPGDQFLFRKGDTFNGTLVINRSGAIGNPITIGSYGTGANPVINGFTNVTTWMNLGGNIWESMNAVSALTSCNMVTIGGINTPMGRFPNSGYLSYSSATGTSTVCASLNASTTNWAGAEIVIKANDFHMDRYTISAHSGTTITNASLGATQAGSANFGCFIQNDVRTLDAQNEWYYNPSTKKIRIFSTSTPTGVKIAALSNLLSDAGFDNITIDGVDFTGSSADALDFSVGVSDRVIIQNCNVSFAGKNGIEMVGNSGLIDNCTVDNVAGAGLYLGANGVATTITNNTITHCNNIVGEAYNTNLGRGIHTSQTPGGLMQYNTVRKIGSVGISVTGGSRIFNNWVDSSVLLLNDFGAIYTAGASSARVIYGNIVTNALGQFGGVATAGTPVTTSATNGIYLDEQAANVLVSNNTSAHCGLAGYMNHMTNHDSLLNNTAFDCRQSVHYEDKVAAGGIINNMVVRSNIFFARTAAQFTFSDRNTNPSPNDIRNYWSVLDSNIYLRPIDDNLTFETRTAGSSTIVLRSLAGWQTFITKDGNSTKSALTITNVNQLDFEFNPTKVAVVKTLPPGTWKDARLVKYTGTVTLQPYTSVVLINTGAVNIDPVANAGTNKNITLPTSSVTQAGSGTDADGTIVAYAWTYISGPGGATIVSPTSATTNITGLVAGTHVIQLMVTDNSGGTATATATIIVNPTPPVNIPPTADAGGNKNITLPTATVTQTGSGNDVDGTIAGYSWAKTSGPATYTIVSSTSATTVINGLVAGTYVFTLTVTDNLGATGTATATIIVNPALNVNPTAIAGTDQTMTWPVNGVTLSGSGTDTDGTISAYAWTKVSGKGGTITSPGTANTTVTGLFPGVYIYQLQVTDNSGGTGVDNIQITVNKGSATATFINMSATFTNLPLSPSITTTPAGLTFSITLNGVTGGQTNAGSYAAVGAITDTNYISSPISGTFVIGKQTVIINATSATFNYDALQHYVVATTTPAATVITYLFDGVTATPPSAIGVHTEHITLVNSNIQATPVDINVTIVSNPAIIFISDTTKVYNASPQTVTVTSAYSYSLTGVPQTNAGVYPNVIATINDGVHVGADTATLTIAKATPVLSWTQPANIPQGSKLSALQLSATSSIAGTITYNHVIGEILPLGSTIITGTFTPSDPANYNGGTIQRTINVYAVNQFLKFLIIGPGGQIIFIEQ